MKIKDKEQIMEIYREMNYGDRIEITRDLSYGKLKLDMIQTIGLQVLPKNKEHILNLLLSFPVIDIKISKEDRFKF